MAVPSVVCVWTGNKYSPEYVEKLGRGVRRHLQVPHRLVCLTDRTEQIDNFEMVDISGYKLPGWWAKMLVFRPELRGSGRAVYVDLDSVPVSDLSPLLRNRANFAICENFTRLAGNTKWPCRYGSCVMTFAGGWGEHVWHAFHHDHQHHMQVAGNLGDQFAIQELVPNAPYLQNMLPPGFFLGYRDLREEPPPGTALVIFAGRNKPHECRVDWVQREWA
jgi:hypothetical protein